MHIQDLALGFLQDRPFQLRPCAISTTAPIDFKEQLKATTCDRSGKPSDLRLQLSKWHLHLRYFDLSPTAAPTRCPAMNAGTLFLLLLLRSIHELLHMLCFPSHLKKQNTSSDLNNNLQTLLFDRGWRKQTNKQTTEFLPPQAYLVAFRKQVM